MCYTAIQRSSEIKQCSNCSACELWTFYAFKIFTIDSEVLEIPVVKVFPNECY